MRGSKTSKSINIEPKYRCSELSLISLKKIEPSRINKAKNCFWATIRQQRPNIWTIWDLNWTRPRKRMWGFSKRSPKWRNVTSRFLKNWTSSLQRVWGNLATICAKYLKFLKFLSRFQCSKSRTTLIPFSKITSDSSLLLPKIRLAVSNKTHLWLETCLISRQKRSVPRITN